MSRTSNFIAAAALTAISATASSAAVVEYGDNSFQDGWASWISYDDAANRGTLNDRDNPANALGDDTGSFFEIGFGSSVDLMFGTAFVSPGTLIEVTNGSVASWPESVNILVGNKNDPGSFFRVGTMSNADAQNPGGEFTFAGGPFDTIRLVDTSTYPTSDTGGWDIAAVRVSAVPLPATLPLMVAGMGLFGFAARHKRKQPKA